MRSTPRTVAGAGGLALAVFERGTSHGRTVLLVHGYPDTHDMWELVGQRLAADHHVVAYDVRGAGASGAPTGTAGYRMAALVTDLVAVADAVSPDGPVHLVGHDWGSIQSWAAVTDAHPALRARFATFTSISGPSLDHVSAWTLDHRRPGQGRWRTLARQLARSWYIAALMTPLAPFAWRHGLARRFAKLVAGGTTSGPSVDTSWPAPTLADDAARGVALYRANLGRRARQERPPATPTKVPILLLVPGDDAFVTPALLDGIEALAPDLERRDVTGDHWLPRSRPHQVATWIAAHIAAHDAAHDRPSDRP